MKNSDLLQLLKISRPRFYSYLAGPFAVGWVVGASSLNQFNSWQFWLLFLFFTLPANLLLYGINDLFDRDTDQFNLKKLTHEHLLQQKQSNLLKRSLLIVGLAATALAISLPQPAAYLLLVFLILSVTYSAPPIRFKARPFFDAYSNILYAVPGFVGFYLVGNSLPSLLVILLAWFWTAGMHTFSAIPDIKPDKKASITTTAVLLGEKLSLIFVTINWFAFSTILFGLLGRTGLIGLIYPATALSLLLTKEVSITKAYWFFPYLNTIIGGLAFWYFLWPLL